jgi:four helix bundle protein
MTPEELKIRIKQFACRCVAAAEALPAEKPSGKIIQYQLVRSAFSGASNYRAATRAQSKSHFLAKLNIALEEVDETVDWLESAADLNLLNKDKLAPLLDEGNQIIRILGAAKHTLQLKLGRKVSPASDQSQIINHK